MQLLQHFKDLTIHPKIAKELKGLILQLAIQGKLTKKWREQNPNVEPASVLLEKIKAEKEQLIKDKKIKKEKPLAEISEEEIPYDLPDKWVWCRIVDIIKISSGNGLTSNQMDKSGGIPVYGGNGITGYHTLNNVNERTIVIGRVGFYCGSIHLTEEKAWITDNAFITKYSKTNINRDFLVWLLKGTNLKENENATAQPVISGRKVYPIVISLPPLEEQKAIVSTVNQLFKEVEELETQTKAHVQLKQDFVTSALKQLVEDNVKTQGIASQQWTYLQPHFKTFFNTKDAVKKLRESILQLAVQGKLTKHWRSQNPCPPLEEVPTGGVGIEHAAILLERIKAKKEQLIIDKKIKKEKPLPEITEEEIPFELPYSWVWCKLVELSSIQDPNPSHRMPKYLPIGIPFVSTMNIIGNDLIDFNIGKKVDDVTLSEQIERFDITESSFAFSRIGTIGKTCNLPIQRNYCLSHSLCVITSWTNDINPDFLRILVMSPEVLNQAHIGVQSVGVPDLGLGVIRNFIIGLPSVFEQKAIVTKVNNLMTFCDQLEQQIEQNTKQVEDLMKSCLKEVFEGAKVDSQN